MSKKKKMYDIELILEQYYNNLSVRRSEVPLFRSDPGQGKTQIINAFAKKKGADIVTFIASQRLPNEISGMSMPDTKKKLMSFFDFDTFLAMKDGDILFLDEVLNANPMVMNAFLNMLEDRRTISGKKLADIFIVAAGNPQGSLIMTPQQKERFTFFDVGFNPEKWSNHFYNTFGPTPESITSSLCQLIEAEKFENSSVHYFTPRSIFKNVNKLLLDIEIPEEFEVKLLPILNMTVENFKEEDVKVSDDFTWKQGEIVPWLTLAKELSKSKEINND